MKSRPPAGYLCANLAVALLCTGSLALAQDNSSSGSGDQISALKAQIQSLQKQQLQYQKDQQNYQDRITQMEGEMKAMESKADSGSILNTRILTDADGKEVAAAPTLDESFLKSLTRNFTFSAYVRAGFQFNGNGGGGNFSFSIPDFPGAGRMRLGNEDDQYMELTWMQSHMLGDSPDVMDVSMTFTPAIAYQQQKTSFPVNTNVGVEANGNDFKFVLRQAFLSASNIFKAAPEITVWSGVRFYDRFNTDPEDYFWLDTSGYGTGVQNINVGIGQLEAAWIGGLNPSIFGGDVGTHFKQTFDVRLKNIDVGFGHLALVLIGNYEKGGNFNQTYSNGQFVGTTFEPNGNIIPLTNPFHTDSAWGIGGGAIYNVNFGPGGGNNSFQAYVLFGRGATNFGAGDDIGTIQGAENLYLFRHPGFTGTVNVGDAFNHAFTYRAGFQAYIALPWYHSEPAPVAGTSKDGKSVAPVGPAPAAPLPWFSVGLFGDWEESYNGYAIGGATGPGIGVGGNIVDPGASAVSKIVSGHVHDIQFGTRPAIWFADNLALQGQFGAQYESNNRAGSGYPGFGHSGWLGVFDVGPVIKPKGGYYTKPEIRFFATYAVWSNSLKGMATPIQENGDAPWAAPYNGNTNHGWLFGTQVEWFF